MCPRWCCLLVAQRPSNMLVHLMNGSVRHFYVFSYWDRSCRSNFLPHPVKVYWQKANQSQRWPYNASRKNRVATGRPIFKSVVWLDLGKIPAQAGFEPRIFRSRGGRLNHSTRKNPKSTSRYQASDLLALEADELTTRRPARTWSVYTSCFNVSSTLLQWKPNGILHDKGFEVFQFILCMSSSLLLRGDDDGAGDTNTGDHKDDYENGATVCVERGPWVSVLSAKWFTNVHL